MSQTNSTSWEDSSEWYHGLVGEEGHYYHKHLLFPCLLSLLKTKKADQSLLDLGCGQGAFALALFKEFSYVGVDISPSLIKAAKTHAPNREFHVQDVCTPFDLGKTFTHATMLLSLQNMEKPQEAFMNVKRHLKQGGTLILVLNHPCFRIPRQSSWGIDDNKKSQYRRIDSYMSPMNIPINMKPGQGKEVTTLSFHYPLSHLFSWLHTCGFTVANLHELCSNKQSVGKCATMENRARREIPLFLVLVAKSL